MSKTSNEQAKLLRRFDWADKVLQAAGYELHGESHTHGLSRYYVRDGAGQDCDESDFSDHVRIRVSDHYAHPYRYNVLGGKDIDFGVHIDAASTRQVIEKATKEAIQEHAK